MRYDESQNIISESRIRLDPNLHMMKTHYTDTNFYGLGLFKAKNEAESVVSKHGNSSFSCYEDFFMNVLMPMSRN